MTISLLETKFISGAQQAIGTKLSLDAALEANLVNTRAAVYVGSNPHVTQSIPNYNPSTLAMELGLSLSDQGRSPAYASNPVGEETTVKVWSAKNPFNFCKRWSKGGLRMNRSAGKSGDTIPGALARIKDVMEQTELPRYVFVWLGGNDVNAINNTDSSAQSVFLQMQADTAAIVFKLQAARIVPIVLTMPDNATWQVAIHRMRTHYRYINWLREFCRENKVQLIEVNNVLTRPLTQVPRAATVSRAGTTATVTDTAHGNAVGDYVSLSSSSNSAADQLTFAAILTVADANTYTFTHSGSGTLTNVSTTATRSMVYPAYASDGTTHFTERGARRVGKVIWDSIKNLFPPQDILSSGNNDFYNLVGCGTTFAIPQISNNAFAGATGTISGTGTITGTMPDGWTLNAIAGSPTVAISLVARTDSPYTNRNWLSLAITAGGSDAQFQIQIVHSKPSAWTAATAATVNSTIIRPTTQTGLFAVCISSGTTNASVQPNWPTTPGVQVVDGSVTWEMRAGWKDGDVCWAGIEYLISAMSANTAIESMAFGLFDETTTANHITDHAYANADNPPEYEVNETGYLVTPEAVLAHDTTGSINFSVKIRVKAGATATINLDRPTWRKVGLGI